MRSMKMVGLVAMATMAVTAIVGTGSASAYATLMEGGVDKNQSVAIEASLKAETDTILETTTGTKLATCTASDLKVATEPPYTPTVSGKVSTLSFTCISHTMRVLSPGTLTVDHIKGTTNGTVFLSGAEWEMEWESGAVDICKVATGSHFGILTGTASGHATLDLNSIVACGFFSSLRMKGTYIVTSPTGLGVSE